MARYTLVLFVVATVIVPSLEFEFSRYVSSIFKKIAEDWGWIDKGHNLNYSREAAQMITESSQNLYDSTCVRDGLFKNPQNCSSFIQCTNGTTYVQLCPAGLQFNENAKRCEFPCDAFCDKSLAEECGWTHKERDITAEICAMPSDVGPCDIYIPLYFYDSISRECRSFIFGGCGGNPNKFETKEKCERGCLRYQDICRLPLEKGPCRETHKRYHFNANRNRCKLSQYGGCEGNANNFETIKDSEIPFVSSDTSIHNPPTEDSLHPQEVCSKDGLYADPQDCGRFVQCSNGVSHGIPCPKGLHFSDGAQRCQSPCDAHCNNTIACQCGWPECKELEVDCEADPLVGPCKVFKRRYFYDRDNGHCRRFTYGGCGGNTNNFVNKEECKQKCQIKLLRDFRCPEKNGKFADYFDCPSYFDCRRGKATLKRCPRGTAFDFKKWKCVIEYEAECLYKCRDRDAVYPYRFDCHKYIDCVNGIPKVERCPPGLAFDGRKRDCVEESTELCPPA